MIPNTYTQRGVLASSFESGLGVKSAKICGNFAFRCGCRSFHHRDKLTGQQIDVQSNRFCERPYGFGGSAQ